MEKEGTTIKRRCIFPISKHSKKCAYHPYRHSDKSRTHCDRRRRVHQAKCVDRRRYHRMEMANQPPQSASRQEFDEQLIIAVRQFPCLYDPASKEYRDVERTSEAWKEACKMCGKLDPAQCKERWRKLRDAYVKVNKKFAGKDGHGDDGAKHTSWPYYEMMSFLADHVKHRKKTADFGERTGETPEKAVTVEYRIDNSPIHILPDVNESSGSHLNAKRLSWPDESCTPRAKSKKARRNVDTIEMALLESLGQGSKVQADIIIDDEEGLFGKMVAATLRRFPPRAKALCKFKIQEIIFELENENLNSSSP